MPLSKELGLKMSSCATKNKPDPVQKQIFHKASPLGSLGLSFIPACTQTFFPWCLKSSPFCSTKKKKICCLFTQKATPDVSVATMCFSRILMIILHMISFGGKTSNTITNQWRNINARVSFSSKRFLNPFQISTSLDEES